MKNLKKKESLNINFRFNFYFKYIGEYQKTVSEIQLEISIVEFDMIYLICDDLKSSLVKITRQHILKLLNVLITAHRNECKR